MALRGDKELYAIMDGMGDEESEKYGNEDNGSVPGLRTGTDERPGEEERRLVPEVGWNKSIWNPHVSMRVRHGAHVTVGSTFSRVSARSAVVSPYEETLRQQAVAYVFTRFQVLGKEIGIKVKNEMFERWQFSRKLKEGQGRDPIIPAKAFSDEGLHAELLGLGVGKAQAHNFCCELGHAAKVALQNLSRQLRSPVVACKGVVAKRVDESTYILQLGKNRLRLNSAHYTKMKQLFKSNGFAAGLGDDIGVVRRRNARQEEDSLRVFHNCLFACLMRYEALQGGGFQASLKGDAFDSLLRFFDVRMECFASPFNCRYAPFCSAFPDVDAPFGSVGSFFDFEPCEGAFEANPPFVREVILKMAQHMEYLLKATDKALMFVVIIPAWEDAPGWQSLRESRFLTRHLWLDQKDHAYCEGKQQLRRTRFRMASFHTSVFFLQTPAAAAEHPVTEEICEEVREAFTLRELSEGDGGGSSGNEVEGKAIAATVGLAKQAPQSPPGGEEEVGEVKGGVGGQGKGSWAGRSDPGGREKGKRRDRQKMGGGGKRNIRGGKGGKTDIAEKVVAETSVDIEGVGVTGRKKKRKEGATR